MKLPLVSVAIFLTFDTHSIAGNKLSKLLLDPPVQPLDESSTEPTQETPQKKKPKLKKTSPSNSSPSRSTSEQSPSSAKGTPSFNQVYGVSPSSSVSGSPPGYPHPLYQTRAHPHLPWEPDNQRSPLSVNISRLTATFGSADVTDDYEDEQAELVRAEPSRDYDFVRGDRNSSFAFATYSSSGDPSYLYRSGHGRQGCRKTCRNAENPPNNCGYHSQWQLPLGSSIAVSSAGVACVSVYNATKTVATMDRMMLRNVLIKTTIYVIFILLYNL